MPNRKFNCLMCGKFCKEPTDLKGFRGIKTNDTQVEVEYIDYCKKCANKKLKKERFQLRLGSAIENKILTSEEIDNWKNKKISQKDFLETLQKKEKLLRC